MPTPIRVQCPECGSEDICSREFVEVSVRITGWTRDGVGGDVTPEIDYDDQNAHWEGMRQDENEPFRCRECDWSFGFGEMVVIEDGAIDDDDDVLRDNAEDEIAA